ALGAAYWSVPGMPRSACKLLSNALRRRACALANEASPYYVVTPLLSSTRQRSVSTANAPKAPALDKSGLIARAGGRPLMLTCPPRSTDSHDAAAIAPQRGYS